MQHKVECYEIEWQNVSLREFSCETFVTIERRDVSFSFTMYPVIYRFSRIEVYHGIAFAFASTTASATKMSHRNSTLRQVKSFATVPCWSRCIKHAKCPLARVARMVFM